MSVVLASGSEVRARLLRAAGISVDVLPAHIDEEMLRESFLSEGVAAEEIATNLAALKAQKVSSAKPDALVIGADQLLVFEGNIIGKTTNVPEARALLRRLSGQVHTLIAAAVLAKNGALLWSHVETVELHMRNFSDAFLDSYLDACGESVLDSVGCYHFEGEGVQLFKRISGDYFTILGLPLLPLLSALREFAVIPA